MAQKPRVLPATPVNIGKNNLQTGIFNAADAMYADTLPFYPSQKYLDKNLAPEQFPKESVKAAARAARIAVDSGVISPSMATMILPNILTENRPDDFGVNVGRWEKGSSAPIGQIVKKLGLDKTTVVDKDIVSSAVGQLMGIQTNIPLYKKGDIVIQPKSGDNPAELEYNAKLMAAVLAEKARQSGGDDKETIRRWNGQGKGAENHLSKVMEASGLLMSAPGNKEIMELFKSEFLRDVKKPDPMEGKI